MLINRDNHHRLLNDFVKSDLEMYLGIFNIRFNDFVCYEGETLRELDSLGKIYSFSKKNDLITCQIESSRNNNGKLIKDSKVNSNLDDVERIEISNTGIMNVGNNINLGFFMQFYHDKETDIICRNHEITIIKNEIDEENGEQDVNVLIEDDYEKNQMYIEHGDNCYAFNKNGLPAITYKLKNMKPVETKCCSLIPDHQEQFKWVCDNDVSIDLFGNIINDEDYIAFKMKFQ